MIEGKVVPKGERGNPAFVLYCRGVEEKRLSYVKAIVAGANRNGRAISLKALRERAKESLASLPVTMYGDKLLIRIHIDDKGLVKQNRIVDVVYAYDHKRVYPLEE